MRTTSISDQLFFNTIKIETISKTGQTGSGTGFFYRYEDSKGHVPFIVTNKHVVNETVQGTLHFQRKKDDKPAIGEGINLIIDGDNWASMWVGHPDPSIDIAVCASGPLLHELKNELNFEPFYSEITEAIVPSTAQISQLSSLEDITFVGYPNGIWDNFSKLPVVRKGTTATPIGIDFEKTPKFLIDASVFGGSSGSPVYLYNSGQYTTNQGIMVGNRIYFVGVVAAVYQRTAYNEIVAMPIPTNVQPMAIQNEMIDLGIVYKASTVVETVNHFISLNGLN